jgi:hypothetical protein
VAAGWPATPWIVASALVFRVCGLWATPTLEDDYQRYLWDGWRTVQDGSPYDHPPAEFFAMAEKRPPGIETALNELNNPDLTTIYAPVTQLLFAAAAAIAPGSLFTLKLFLLLSDFGILLLLLIIGGPRAAWFMVGVPWQLPKPRFTPIEAWALLWLLAARLLPAKLLSGRRPVATVGGSLCLLAVPFLAWRRPAIILPAFLAVLGIIYVPILATGSSAEWGGLHAMAGSFEFNSFGYALLAAMFGSSAARSLWLILFGVVATILFVRWAQQKQSLQQAPMTDVSLAFFLLTPVLNPWYLVWLVPFVALAPTRRAVALLVGVPLSYATGLNLGDPTLATYGQPNWVRPIEFGFFLLAALSTVWSTQRAGRETSLLP